SGARTAPAQDRAPRSLRRADRRARDARAGLELVAGALRPAGQRNPRAAFRGSALPALAQLLRRRSPRAGPGLLRAAGGEDRFHAAEPAAGRGVDEALHRRGRSPARGRRVLLPQGCKPAEVGIEMAAPAKRKGANMPRTSLRIVLT